LHQELLHARLQIESQSTQILSLEAALSARPAADTDDSVDDDEKEGIIAEQAGKIRELEELILHRRENNDGQKEAEWKLRYEAEVKTREEAEKVWKERLEEEVRKREEKETWAAELGRAFEKEKKV